MNVSWLDRGRLVQYRQMKTFFFRRDLSAGGEDDMVTIPNVPMIVSSSREPFSWEEKNGFFEV